jgi:hypothetical protein
MILRAMRRRMPLAPFDFGALVKMLLLTAQRVGKVGKMQWQDIEGVVWHNPSEHREKANGGIWSCRKRLLTHQQSTAAFKGIRTSFPDGAAVPSMPIRSAGKNSMLSDKFDGPVRQCPMLAFCRTLPSVFMVMPSGVEGVYGRHDYFNERQRRWKP